MILSQQNISFRRLGGKSWQMMLETNQLPKKATEKDKKFGSKSEQTKSVFCSLLRFKRFRKNQEINDRHARITFLIKVDE